MLWLLRVFEQGLSHNQDTTLIFHWMDSQRKNQNNYDPHLNHVLNQRRIIDTTERLRICFAVEERESTG